MIYYSYIDRFERKIVSDKDKKIKEVYSVSGEPIGDTYEYKVIDGIKTLVPTGKVNRQEYIESFAEAQDINNIIKRFLDGDTDAINPQSGFYGDFTNYPRTYAELFDRLQQCENVFNSMPSEIKEKFDNSVEKFWSQFNTESFNKVFSEYNNEKIDVKPIDNKESEVKNAE